MSEVLKTRYAIVGAGIAGIAAAEEIRSIDPVGEIVMISGEDAPAYCRPLIVEMMTEERAADEITLRHPGWFEERDVSFLAGDRAVRLDTGRNLLVLESGQVVEWEKLLLATGSLPTTPPIPGLGSAPWFHLHDRGDADRLREAARPGARVLVMGIGLIGLRAITALRAMELEVSAVEALPKVLPLILDCRAAALVQRRLEEYGVTVHVNSPIQKVVESGASGWTAVAESAREIGFDFLVVATGVRPDLSLTAGTSIETGRGIQVSPSMETSVPGIYAAGDVTEYPDWIEGRSQIHAHWVNASRQGRIAGLSMAGAGSEPYEPVYLNSLDIFGLPVITMGASRLDDLEDARVFLDEVADRPAYTRLVVQDGRLIAGTFVNDVDRAGMIQFLLRNKVEVGEKALSLFERGLEGMELLHALQMDVVLGQVEWAPSMDMIDRYRKDMKKTRWGDEPHQEGGRP